MARLEFRPFSAEFVASAGDLLAERHRTHRAAEPLLPERYEDPAAAAAEIEVVASSEAASGSVALRGGRVVGYLLGIRKDDETWGANVWVEPAGHAVAEAEDLRDLYAAASERWVADGRVRHYALVPATDAALVDAWWRAGFGQQHAGGIREVPDAAWPDDVRLATEDDLDALIELSPVIADHQARAPVFGVLHQNETEAELRAKLLEDLKKPEIGDLVVERDSRIVGAFQIVPVELSAVHAGLARPEGAALLGWAATFPDVRGSGAGVALTEGAFAWARDRGHAIW